MKSLLKFQKEVRDLRKIMPFRDAWDLARKANESGTIQIYLFPVKRPVSIRLGTSDVDCLKQVFLNNEYLSPFKITPKFIVDVGANIGMATLSLAAQFPEAHILAIEPEASNFKMLKENCAGLANITLREAALWGSYNNVFIQNPSADKWSFTVGASPGKEHPTRSLPTVTIPMLLRETGNNKIDFLKLDIEGSELELFSTNVEPWLNKVGVIAIELHDKFRHGCAKAFYTAITKRPFIQEVKAENIFIQFEDPQP